MSYDVAIAHERFRPLGGGERVALAFAKAMLRRGYRAAIYAVDPPEPTDVKNMAPEYADVVDQVDIVKVRGSQPWTLLHRRTGRFTRLYAAANLSLTLRAAAEAGASLIIDTFTNAPAAPVVYFNYANHAFELPGGGVYDWLIRRYVRSVTKVFGRTTTAMANSSWTARKVKEAFGLDAEVVYPPVDIEAFAEAADGPHNEDIIVTVARLGFGKSLESIVDVASRLKDYGFFMVGAIQEDTERFVKSLRSRMESLGVDNVYLFPNYPKDKLIDLMSRAKAYLHPPYPEHFGIAVAEAMAAGLPPVVYRDGGAWTDMVSKVDPGLGYATVDEAVRALRHAVENREALAAKGAELARRFTYRSFERSLLAALRQLGSASLLP